MAAIPGWVYILVGAVVAGFSAYTRERTGSQVMLFFFIIGFVFLIIGVLKIAWGYWSGRSQYGKADITGLEAQENRREALRAQPANAQQPTRQDSRKLEVEPDEIDMPLDPSRSQALNKMYSQQANAQQQGQQPQQPPRQQQTQPSSNSQQPTTASQMFPFKGIHHAQQKRANSPDQQNKS